MSVELCDACGGDGELFDDTDCPACDGRGFDLEAALRHAGVYRELEMAKAVNAVEKTELARRDRSEKQNVLFRKTLRKIADFEDAPLKHAKTSERGGKLTIVFDIADVVGKMKRLALDALNETDL